jgi:hypothetical protein
VENLYLLTGRVDKGMIPVDNQLLVSYSTGAIQMVPGGTGYVPARQRDDFEETGFKQASRETRHQRPRLLNDKHETTYTENRRLTSHGTSNLGSFIDIYA